METFNLVVDIGKEILATIVLLIALWNVIKGKRDDAMFCMLLYITLKVG